jgi:secreted trypsin-like serine protease
MRRIRLVITVAVLMALVTSPVRAITFGEPDGAAHPWVGAFVAEFDGHKSIICSGTLIAPTVFVTAAHCTAYLEEVGIAPDAVWVTFDSVPSLSGTFIPATYHHNPLYTVKGNDEHDVAVLTLATDPGVAPASLPTRNLLADATNRWWFTTVGYGTERNVKETGWHALFGGDTRKVATQRFQSMDRFWVTMSMNPSTGNGGTCYGDSGGPHFLRDTKVVVSVTVTGDRWCRATDKTYRLDTDSARAFLGQFVALP